VISEEKLYNQFRTNLQQRLTARESTPESVKPSDTQRGSDLTSQRPLPDSAHNLPPLDLQSQRYNPDTQRQSSRFQTPLASQPTSKPTTNRMQPPQPGSSGNSRPTT
jgi:hypothetical protein